MKTYLLLLMISLLSCGQSYGFADKSIYLVDSLDLDLLNQNDIQLLDSSMHIIAKEAQEYLDGIKVIIDVIDNIEDYPVAEKYNTLLLNGIKSLLLDKGVPAKDKNTYLHYMAVVLSNQGHFASSNGQISLAIESFKNAILIQQGINDLDYLGLSYMNLGGTYYQIGEIDQALNYFIQARSFFEVSPNAKNELILVLNNIAVVYESQGKLELSLKHQYELLELSSENGLHLNVAFAHNSIGGILTIQKKYDLALYHLLEAKNQFEESNNLRWSTLTYTKLGSFYRRIGDSEEAFKYALKAEEIVRQTTRLESKMYTSKLLYELNKDAGKFNKALEYFEEYTKIKDSLSGENANIAAVQKELQFKFEQEKELTKNRVNKNLEIANLEKEKKNLIYNTTLAILVIVILFVILLFFRIRLISKQKFVISKQSEERKLLLKEIHHRVKNNFQIISSILKLQSNNTNNSVVNSAFEDAINRIHSMSAVHEMIYRQENFSEIKPQDYFLKLANSMHSYSINQELEFEINSAIEYLNIATLVPLGIAVNELITNSIKYAFSESHKKPKIGIRIEVFEGKKILIYKDNGIGATYNNQRETFGMELINTIIDQIEGEITNIEEEGWNTCLKISFN